jgi:hypothetical protein
VFVSKYPKLPHQVIDDEIFCIHGGIPRKPRAGALAHIAADADSLDRLQLLDKVRLAGAWGQSWSVRVRLSSSLETKSAARGGGPTLSRQVPNVMTINPADPSVNAHLQQMASECLWSVLDVRVRSCEMPLNALLGPTLPTRTRSAR